MSVIHIKNEIVSERIDPNAHFQTDKLVFADWEPSVFPELAKPIFVTRADIPDGTQRRFYETVSTLVPGRRIQAIREILSLSQESLATMTGLPIDYLRGVEKLEKDLTLSACLKIRLCPAFGLYESKFAKFKDLVVPNKSKILRPLISEKEALSFLRLSISKWDRTNENTLRTVKQQVHDLFAAIRKCKEDGTEVSLQTYEDRLGKVYVLEFSMRNFQYGSKESTQARKALGEALKAINQTGRLVAARNEIRITDTVSGEEAAIFLIQPGRAGTLKFPDLRSLGGAIAA